MGAVTEERLNRRQIAAWCLFDFANSSYSAVVAAVVFQVFYINSIVGNDGGQGDLWWGRAISLSMLLVSISSPFIGGIADFGGWRKRILLAYTALCVAAVASFSILSPGDVVLGFVLIVIANIGMEGGLVFYNAYLPEIAPPSIRGRVSGWGFAVGYAGSIIALLISLPLAKAGRLDAVWWSVAIFFAIFSVPAFLLLPPDPKGGASVVEAGRRGARGAWETLKEVWSQKNPRRFLVAYLLYEDGVNTVIVFSSSLAATTFGFSQGELVSLYLVVQVTALAGAWTMARPTDAWGPKAVVSISLLLWSAVAVAAYFVPDKRSFWMVACVAGLGLGTVQAASRAFFARFVPHGKEAEWFGAYALVGKSSAVMGPLVFGAVSVAFGSQRPAILAIGTFFAVGLLLLSRVGGGGPSLVDGYTGAGTSGGDR